MSSRSAATPETYLLTGFDSEDKGLSVEDALTLFTSADGEFLGVPWRGRPHESGVAASVEGTIVGTGFPELWATTDLERWERVWDGHDRNPADDVDPARWLAPWGYGERHHGWTGSAFATTGFLFSPVCLDHWGSCPPTPWLLLR